jgi:hypothetical protein
MARIRINKEFTDRETPASAIQEKFVQVSAPKEFITLEKIVEVPGPKEIIFKYIDKPVYIDREVYIDRIVEVEKLVEKEILVTQQLSAEPIYIDRVVEKIIEAAPVTYIKEKIVYKVPPFMWGVLVVESVLLFVAFQIMK